MFNDKNILITGGTGSFGKKTIETLLKDFNPNKIIVFSRDELKQFELRQQFPPQQHKCLRYFLGDVRDIDRLYEAFNGVDFIIHAAALKQVPAGEYNPFEVIKTNVLGGQNVIQAAIRCNVKKVIALSTDKAAAPVNLYGATKLCSDKLFINGNQMSGRNGCLFAVVRYGNVFGSRGSVIPLFLQQKHSGTLHITDPRMTRFSITIEEAVRFTLDKFKIMQGGELFVPKIPSYRLTDLALSIAPAAKLENIGIRPGEKLHECMITEDDARVALEFDGYYAVLPNFEWFHHREKLVAMGGKPCAEGFSYTSGNNSDFLNVAQIQELVKAFCKEYGINFK